MTELEVIFVLNYKDDMIKLGIIPENVKWDELTDKQIKDVKAFLKDKIEKRKELWK